MPYCWIFSLTSGSISTVGPATMVFGLLLAVAALIRCARRWRANVARLDQHAVASYRRRCERAITLAGKRPESTDTMAASWTAAPG
mgnify:CR=1 FL=1